MFKDALYWGQIYIIEFSLVVLHVTYQTVANQSQDKYNSMQREDDFILHC